MVAGEHNPIFQKIFNRVATDDDKIIAYIAYGIYKERKRTYLIKRQEELGTSVSQEEIDTFVRTCDGQIDLFWDAATESLGVFAVNYADAEKDVAAKEALADALKGHFWKQVGVASAANLIFAVGVVVVYFLLRVFGLDLVDRLRALEQTFPN